MIANPVRETPGDHPGMDRLTPERRSWLMSRVASRNTRPEMLVRQALHHLGYRYRLHDRKLPGKPDLVFSSRHKVLLVNGCFWHGHRCRYGRAVPKSNVEFWSKKFAMNRARDARVRRELRALGWRVHTIWECEVKSNKWLEATIRFLDGAE